MSFDAMEDAIAARLTDVLGDMVRKVYTAAELADVDENQQLSPGIMVAYNGLAPIQVGGGSQGKIQQIEHSWFVVVHGQIGNAINRGPVKKLLAPIIETTLRALIGWRPPIDGEMPLALAPSPAASFTDANFAYYPIAFSNRRTYRGID